MRTLAALCLITIGCAGAKAPPAAAPLAPAQAAPANASNQTPRPKLPEPAAVPPPPAVCRDFATPATCTDAGSTAQHLARAIELDAVIPRDRELRCLEARWPEGAPLVRMLRADLGPAECADAIVTPYLEAPPHKLGAVEESALLGLLISGRLSRLVGTPPSLAPPFDKQRFQQYFEQQLRPWMIGQALAIGELSVQGSKLTGYGKAIAAIAASQADLRFVRAVRAVPLPAELAQDTEFKNTYEAALDEALEPRKVRGRDAALVGLRILAELGAAHGERLAAARSQLAELYAGGRVDALERLLLPELPPLTPKTIEERLAAKLPTFYAGLLLSSAANLRSPGVIRAFAERGVPANVWPAFDAGGLPRDALYYYASAEVRRGIAHFSAPAFEHARAILGPAPAGERERLLSALISALMNAPRDAAELMLKGPRLPGPLGSLDALDALAKQPGEIGGLAEFDAAYLRSLTPLENDPAFWTDLAERYARAEKKLKSARDRALAHASAEEARQIAKSLERR